MSLMKRNLSARRAASSRASGRKSPGPRTPEGKRRSSLNALKHGLNSPSSREVMTALGEDPRDFERLSRDLVSSLAPANRVEAQIVEDLARLWWKRARADRAQTALQLTQIERLELERRRELDRLNRQGLNDSEERIAEVGLLRAKDCAAKFQEALNYLAFLIARVERHQGFQGVEDALDALYGHTHTWRGGMIRSAFTDLFEKEVVDPEMERLHAEQERALREAEKEAEEHLARLDKELADEMAAEYGPDRELEQEGSQSEEADAEYDDAVTQSTAADAGAAPGVVPASDEIASPSDPLPREDGVHSGEKPGKGGDQPTLQPKLEVDPQERARRAYVRAGLVQLLLQEWAEVLAQQELFLAEHAEISPTTRDACLAPSDSRWLWMLRLDSSIDRQIDRKLKIIIRLQAVRRRSVSPDEKTTLKIAKRT